MAQPSPAREPVRVPKGIERRARTSEVVADSIRAQIARGELRAGDRFPPEDELMGVFGIARTTLREALRILESEGLVTVVRGRNGGPRVTAPTVENMTRSFALLLQVEGIEMADIYDACTMIEPHLVHLLAANRTPRALAELKQAIEGAAAGANADDAAAFGEAAIQVHDRIFQHAGNASLGIFAQLLHGVIAAGYRRSSQAATGTQRRRAVKSYRKLYKLIEAGDAEGAEQHWRLHMTYLRTRESQPVEAFS
ncbi:MAG TPA: FCD domain-containing protein [Amycolatopsis sp.]|nr:FCD domain-containing protein [Amycolatopsis sp.]